MKIRPYLTYSGKCAEAVELYKRAFNTTTNDYMRFSDMPPSKDFIIPDAIKDQVMQATLKIGADFIRMSDCGPGHTLNEAESERISLSFEANSDEVKHAFAVLSEEGRVAMPLAETFYSPCAGVVFDKYGVMWSFAAI
ncbi:MAG: VOC family protein [Holophagales bacterium]|jgi:PhnB protein|nr:VOC family protein [Holophagales bacterium]